MVTIEGLGPAGIGTIYGIGRNYAEHAKELGTQIPDKEPVVFLKAASSVRPLVGGPIAFGGEGIHFEAELVIRIGQTVPMGTNPVGWQFVDAIGLGLDLTRRDQQNHLKSQGLPWTLAKSFAGASVISPLIRTSELGGQTTFKFKFFVEEKLRQAGDTGLMIFSVPDLIKFLATSNTLLPGDLIFTGTPSGVGPINKGQNFRLELENPHRSWNGII